MRTCMSWDERLVKDGRAWKVKVMIFCCFWHDVKSSLRVKIPDGPAAFPAADGICFLSHRLGNTLILCSCGDLEMMLWFHIQDAAMEIGVSRRVGEQGGSWRGGCFWGMRPPPPPGRNWGGIITNPEEDWWRVESTEEGNMMVAAGQTEACRRYEIHPIISIWGFKAQFSQLWRVFQSPVEVPPVPILFFCSQARCVTFGFSLNDGWI